MHLACSISGPKRALSFPTAELTSKFPAANLGGNGPPCGGVHLGPIFREQQQPAREALHNFHDTPFPVRSELEHSVGSALRPKRRIVFWNRRIVVMIFCFCSDTLGLRKVLMSPLRSTPERTESLGTKRTTHVSHTDSDRHCHVVWLRCEVAQLLPRVRVPRPIAQQLFELFHKLLRFPANELGHLACVPCCASTQQPALRVEYRAAADASNKHTPRQL